jgi:hypothetical protein
VTVRPDVTTALDCTGRRFAFRPAAILGNGSLLATISARGEVERLFWPNVDHGQHLGELRFGIERDGRSLWLDDEPWTWEQTYANGSSVLQTTARSNGTTVEVIDLVSPAEPVLVRGIRASTAERLLVHIAPNLDGDERGGAGYVDPGSGALVFYLRGVALAVALLAGDTRSTLRESNGREPTQDVVVYRAPVEGALAGVVEGEARVLVAFGATPDEAIARLCRPASMGLDALVGERTAYDRETIGLAAPPSDGTDVADLYARSLLVLEQLTDRQTGAAIAAPEFDPTFEQSGGYGFVWPRDLGYVVLSLLAAGRSDLAVPALRWLAREQAPEGLWLQRYWTNGSLAPSWGLHQLDETGMVVFTYEAAWRELHDARPRWWRPAPRGRRLRGRQPVAHLHALARSRRAPGGRRGRPPRVARVRPGSADLARSPPGAGQPRRGAGVGRAARLEPRDAHPRRPPRARDRPRRRDLTCSA